MAERPSHRLRAGTWLTGVACPTTTSVVVVGPESSAVSEALRAWSALRYHDAACGECDTSYVAAPLLDERLN